MLESNITLNPRLIRLLDILLSAENPVKVDTLAQKLETSRRTVFRELENADSVLGCFQGTLTSIAGKGIIFSGEKETRQKLLETLSKYKTSPATKRERLLRLLIELIRNAGNVQKLYFYSDMFKVSESTISSDLDELEKYLLGKNVFMIRRSGFGVYLEGTEEALRTVLVNYFITSIGTEIKCYSVDFDFPEEETEKGIQKLLLMPFVKANTAWLTNESLTLITLYLMVMIERIKKGKIIVSLNEAHGFYQKSLAEKIVDEMERVFSITISKVEVENLALWIEACRAKSDTPLKPEKQEREELITSLTFKMIERFDPNISAILKTNEQLVKFLSRHLQSALTRLEKRIELPNPLEKELITNYYESYEKSCRATEVLEEYLGFKIGTNEITFIQIHFLAALNAMGEQKIKRRILHACVICFSGIGTGYMLSYQIRKKFKGYLEVEVSGYDEKSTWEKVDFLISTIPLEEKEIPTILVKTILREEDYEEIQKIINTLSFQDRKEVKPFSEKSGMEEKLIDIIGVFTQAYNLLDSFSIEYIKKDISFNELVSFASFLSSKENAETICSALTKREYLGTQVVPELEIVLLHAKTFGVNFPLFKIIIPEEKMFVNDYFKKTKACILMLLPENSSQEISKLMGSISSALIDMPQFLKSILEGNKEEIKSFIEMEIQETLAQYCDRKLSLYKEKL